MKTKIARIGLFAVVFMLVASSVVFAQGPDDPTPPSEEELLALQYGVDINPVYPLQNEEEGVLGLSETGGLTDPPEEVFFVMRGDVWGIAWGESEPLRFTDTWGEGFDGRWEHPTRNLGRYLVAEYVEFSYNTHTLFRVDPYGDEVDLGVEGRWPSLSPSGQLIAYVSESGEVIVGNLDIEEATISDPQVWAEFEASFVGAINWWDESKLLVTAGSDLYQVTEGSVSRLDCLGEFNSYGNRVNIGGMFYQSRFERRTPMLLFDGPTLGGYGYQPNCRGYVCVYISEGKGDSIKWWSGWRGTVSEPMYKADIYEIQNPVVGNTLPPDPDAPIVYYIPFVLRGVR